MQVIKIYAYIFFLESWWYIFSIPLTFGVTICLIENVTYNTVIVKSKAINYVHGGMYIMSPLVTLGQDSFGHRVDLKTVCQDSKML